jgi:phasin family protein
MEASLADKPIFKASVSAAAKKQAAAKAVSPATTGLPIVAAKALAPSIKAYPLPPIATKRDTVKPPFAAPARSSESSAVKPPVVAKPAVAAAPAAAVVTPLEPASPVPAALITEGKPKVTETFTKIEENSKNFAAQATTRVKSAMEKGSKGVEELVEFSKGNLEAVVASGRVAAKGAEEMAKYAADYGRTTIEKANVTAKQFAGVKSPAEFFQLQSELAKSSLDALVGEASKFGENYMKLLGEIAQPIQSRYALAVEKVKTAVSA